MKNSINQSPPNSSSPTKAPWTWEAVFLGLKIGTVTTIVLPFLLYMWVISQSTDAPVNSLIIILVLIADALLVVGTVAAIANIVMLILFFILKRHPGFKTWTIGLLILLISIAYLGWIVYTSYLHKM